MKIEANELVVNGVTYVPKGSEQSPAPSVDGLECVVVRTYSAGVFYGWLKKIVGKEATLLQAKRIWCWYGAASLSQLAVDGVSQPEKCKIPVAVPRVELTEVIEWIPLSDKAFRSLESVPVWSA